MNKGLSIFIAILSSLICLILLSSLEAVIGMLDDDAVIFIQFANAAVAYFGGKALYKALLKKKNDGIKVKIKENLVKAEATQKSLDHPQQLEIQASVEQNSTLGAIIAECNLPVALIPRIVNLYRRDQDLLSCLHSGFSDEQLNEIVEGLENGQDVSF